MDSESHRFTPSFREKKQIKDILYWALVAKWSMLVTQSAGPTVLHSLHSMPETSLTCSQVLLTLNLH